MSPNYIFRRSAFLAAFVSIAQGISCTRGIPARVASSEEIDLYSGQMHCLYADGVVPEDLCEGRAEFGIAETQSIVSELLIPKYDEMQISECPTAPGRFRVSLRAPSKSPIEGVLTRGYAAYHSEFSLGDRKKGNKRSDPCLTTYVPKGPKGGLRNTHRLVGYEEATGSAIFMGQAFFRDEAMGWHWFSVSGCDLGEIGAQEQQFLREVRSRQLPSGGSGGSSSGGSFFSGFLS